MKRSTTVTVPGMQDGQDVSYLVTISACDRATTLQIGAEKIGAVKVGSGWYYLADETGEVYRITELDLIAVGAGEQDDRGWDYSLWCATCGKLIRRPSRKVKEALGMDY